MPHPVVLDRGFVGVVCPYCESEWGLKSNDRGGNFNIRVNPESGITVSPKVFCIDCGGVFKITNHRPEDPGIDKYGQLSIPEHGNVARPNDPGLDVGIHIDLSSPEPAEPDDDETYECGAEKATGGLCSITVSGPDERCHHHREEEE